MLQTPPPPLWLELTKAFGGPVIAALFVILGLILKDWIERRNAAQSWYQQTYITEGIDLLISHLNALQSFTVPGRNILLATSEMPHLPPHVLGRLAIVLPSVEFIHACDTVESIVALTKAEHPLILDPNELTELYGFTSRLIVFAEKIRLVLLDTTVHAKIQVYDIHGRLYMNKVVNDGETKFQEGETLHAVHYRFIEKVGPRAAEAALATMSESQKELWRQAFLQAEAAKQPKEK